MTGKLNFRYEVLPVSLSGPAKWMFQFSQPERWPDRLMDCSVSRLLSGYFPIRLMDFPLAPVSPLASPGSRSGLSTVDILLRNGSRHFRNIDACVTRGLNFLIPARSSERASLRPSSPRKSPCTSFPFRSFHPIYCTDDLATSHAFEA